MLCLPPPLVRNLISVESAESPVPPPSDAPRFVNVSFPKGSPEWQAKQYAKRAWLQEVTGQWFFGDEDELDRTFVMEKKRVTAERKRARPRSRAGLRFHAEACFAKILPCCVVVPWYRTLVLLMHSDVGSLLQRDAAESQSEGAAAAQGRRV